MAVREIWPAATRGRPRKRGVASEKPVAARSFLETAFWQRLTWRTGTKGPLAAEFAAVRVRVADGPPPLIAPPLGRASRLNQHAVTPARQRYGVLQR